MSSCDSKNAPENIFISFDLHIKSLIFQVAAVQAVVKVEAKEIVVGPTYALV